MKDQVLFPKIAVREKGFLQVSDIHTIFKRILNFSISSTK